MAELSIGASLGEGFGLIRHRSLSVLAWGLLQLAVSGAAIGLMAPLYTAMMAQIIAATQSGGHAAPPDMAGFQQMQGLSYLISFGGYFVTAVLYCAVFRAVLHPEQRRFAYIRVGSAEFFVFVMMVAAYFGLGFGLVLAAIPAIIVVAILAAAHAIAAAVVVGVAAVIIVIAALVYLMLRFSMMGPMTVSDGKIHFLDAWALTKGKVGSLFMIALCLFAILMVGEIVVGTVFVAAGIGVLSGAAGGVANLPTLLRQSPGTALADLIPLLALAAVFAAPLYGCLLAVMGAPWARAYRDLVGPDLVATFS